MVPVHTDQGFSPDKNTNGDLLCKRFQSLNANFIWLKYRIDWYGEACSPRRFRAG
jgi:hypothetical protein